MVDILIICMEVRFILLTTSEIENILQTFDIMPCLLTTNRFVQKSPGRQIPPRYITNFLEYAPFVLSTRLEEKDRLWTENKRKEAINVSTTKRLGKVTTETESKLPSLEPITWGLSP